MFLSFCSFPRCMAIPFSFAVVFFLASACHNENRVGNTQALNREMKSMKIKRVTPAQLSGILHELGEKVSSNATRSLGTALQQTGGDSLCRQPDQLPLLSKLRETYGIEIHLLYPADTLQAAMNPKEKELLSAYAYNYVHKLPLADNLQTLNDTLSLYHAPLPADHPLLTRCKPTAPFAIWHVLFNTKEVIRRLDPKQLNQ